MATEQFNILFRSSGARTVRREMKGINLGLAAVAFAAVRVGRAFVDTADTFTNLSNRATVFASSAEDAEQRMEDMVRISRELSVGLDDVSGVYGQISIAQDAAGISTAEVTKIVENLSKATLVSGASAQASAGALRQFSQGLAANRFSGQELNSVLEQTPYVAKLLADGIGVATGDLRAMGEAGLLTTDVLVGVFGRGIDQLDEKLANFKFPLSQQLVGLRTELLLAFSELDKFIGSADGLSEALTNAKNAVAQFVNEVKAGEGAGHDMVQGFLQVIEVLKELMPLFKGIAAAWIASGLIGFVASFTGSVVNSVLVVQGYIATIGGGAVKGAAVAFSGSTTIMTKALGALNWALEVTRLKLVGSAGLTAATKVAGGAIKVFSGILRVTGIKAVYDYTKALVAMSFAFLKDTKIGVYAGVFLLELWDATIAKSTFLTKLFGKAAKVAWASATLGLSLLITGLPVLYFWLKENTDKIVEFGDRTTTVGGILEYLKNVGVQTFKVIATSIKGNINVLLAVAGVVYDSLLPAFQKVGELWGWVGEQMNSFLEGAPAAWENFKAIVSNAFSDLGETASRYMQDAKDIITNGWDNISTAVTQTVADLGKSIRESLGIDDSQWENIKTNATNTFKSIGDTIKKQTAEWIKPVENFVVKALNVLGALKVGLLNPTDFVPSFKAEYERLEQENRNLFETIKVGAKEVVQDVTDVGAAVAAAAEAAGAAALETVAPVIETYKTEIEKLRAELEKLQQTAAAGPAPPPGAPGAPETPTDIVSGDLSNLTPRQGEEEGGLLSGLSDFLLGESPTELWTKFADAATSAFERIETSQKGLSEVLEGTLNSTLDGLTDSIVTFANTGENTFKDFARSVVQQLQKVIMKQLLIKALSAAGSAFGGLGDLFGGGGGDALNAGESLTDFSGFAANGGTVGGGKFTPGAPIVVGEKGPELFTPPSRGVITPNNRLGTEGGGGQSVTVVNVEDPQGVQDAMRGTEGEEIIINHIRRNPDLIRGLA